MSTNTAARSRLSRRNRIGGRLSAHRDEEQLCRLTDEHDRLTEERDRAQKSARVRDVLRERASRLRQQAFDGGDWDDGVYQTPVRLAKWACDEDQSLTLFLPENETPIEALHKATRETRMANGDCVFCAEMVLEVAEFFEPVTQWKQQPATRCTR